VEDIVAILQALLAFLSRQVGKILQTTLGWATSMLFGKVPQKRQYVLTGITVASLAWMVVLLGIAFPKVGSFLLAFALPSDSNAGWIRLAMLAAALVLPALVGIGTLFATERNERPHGARQTLRVVMRGYPYTLALALTLLLMTLFAPVIKLLDAVKRRTSAHVPAVIKPDDYRGVVEDVKKVLRQHGFPTREARASWMLRLPVKVFMKLASAAAEGLVVAEMVELVSDRLQIQMHPSDLVIHGKEKDVMRVRAILSEFLVFTEAHMTWTKEANEFEDRLGAVWKALRAGGDRAELEARMQAIDAEIRRAELDYDEWQVVFREKLLVERAILSRAPAVGSPQLARKSPGFLVSAATIGAALVGMHQLRSGVQHHHD
jgi:hypothetical protein